MLSGPGDFLALSFRRAEFNSDILKLLSNISELAYGAFSLFLSYFKSISSSSVNKASKTTEEDEILLK